MRVTAEKAAKASSRNVSNRRRGIQLFYARARLAWARSEKSENCPFRSFGNAAAAIIAALSVESAGVGKNTGQESPAALRGARRPAFDATPPEMMQRSRADFFNAHGGTAQQLFDDGVLKRSQQIERGLRREREKILSRGALRAASGFDLSGEVVAFHPTQARRFSIR